MEITYHKEGDYLIPDLEMPKEESEATFGKYGRLHQKYLKENHKVIYSKIKTSGHLMRCLAEVDQRAKDMMETLMKQMAEKQGVTEVLKMKDMMEWVGRMNNIRNAAEEMVLHQIIYQAE